MHKKVEQAHGRSLRNLFEQLATRILPAALRAYSCSSNAPVLANMLASTSKQTPQLSLKAALSALCYKIGTENANQPTFYVEPLISYPSEGKTATFLPLKQQNRINFCIFEH